MWALGAVGSSSTNYGTNGGNAMWARPDLECMEYDLAPVVKLDNNDSDIYHRYLEDGRLSIDFSSGAEASSIDRY